MHQNMSLKSLVIMSLLVLGSAVLARPIQAATSSSAPAPSCQSYQPIDTQFRPVGQSNWISGAEMSKLNLHPGQTIDVNCFAQNGASLIPGGYIELRYTNGKIGRISDTSELRNFTLPDPAGTLVFTCRSKTIQNCSNTDSLTIRTVASPAPTYRPTPTPTPTIKPSPVPAHQSRCSSLQIVGGNNSLVPAKVTLRASASDNKGSIQRYRYYFGDGKQEETDQAEIQHTYETSGSFLARVDIKDSQGNWKTNTSCEARVTIKSSSLESHKAACSDVFITADNNAKAPSTVTFKISGYDNKGTLKRYKIDFGNGIVKESDGQSFEQRYETAGTYTIKAYVQDSENRWLGGEDSCQKTLYINTKPLTKQPETGTPTWLSLFGITSGLTGFGILEFRRHRTV